ncbi:YceI family protein [Shimia ponticola]|uniref:YceI family protein n=1 Tax=Shimia ponticola TaxID=2582893 RepID=UPI0011BD6ED0|nr:YceI family protein [Shimia ponticola]
MMRTMICAAVTAVALAIPATAETWTLDGSSSRLMFGSVKNEYTGEAHYFDGITGSVSEDGMADLTIDLTSVETYVDIRNERMGEHVFGGIATAGLTAEMDMESLRALDPGESVAMDLDATLALLGEEVPVFAPIYVTRITDDKVMVTSQELVFLATDELGIDGGIDMLKNIAGLDSITRAVPFAFRLMFTSDGTQS